MATKRTGRKTPTTAEIQKEAGAKGAIIGGRVIHNDFDTESVVPDIAFVVYGLPAPQGSKKLVGPRRLVETSAALEPWRKAVRAQAKESILHKEDWDTAIDEEVMIRVVFTFPHSGASQKRGDEYHSIAPDLDKLQRAIGDAISPAPLKKGITKGLSEAEAKKKRDELKAEALEYCVLADDKYIVGWHSKKVYVDATSDALHYPGAAIEVWRVSRFGNDYEGQFEE